MKKLLTLLILFIAAAGLALAQEDAEGSKDPSMFTRMPGFHIYRYDDLQFDRHEFPVNADKMEAVEGHYLFIIYWLNDNVQQPSPIQIVRNYTNAIKKIGGQVIYEFEDGGSQYATIKLVKNGTETWAQVMAQSNGIYNLSIVEKQAMNQDVVADAASMANSIKETGKVAVYGINFDFGKSTLRPESQAVLQQIKKLLDGDPSLKLYVVGHTDNIGDFDSNMKLSNERAASVVNALTTQFGINSARLKGWGDGCTAPVAPNSTDAGRALNRRVELVKQ